MGYPVIPPDPSVVLHERRTLTTPKTLKGVLEDGLTKLATPSVQAKLTGGSPHVPVLLAAHAAAPKRARANILKRVTADHAFRIARGFESGLNLLDMATTADPFVRPMLAYYGCAQFLGAISRAHLIWGGSRTHGLHIKEGADADNSLVVIDAEGFFPRLADTLCILSGRFNLFSARDAAGIPLRDPSRKGGHNATRTLVAVPIPKSVTLAGLVSFDPKGIANAPKDWRGAVNFPQDDPHDPLATAMLIDVLIVFIAGSLCRYHPVLWRDVLEGEKTGIRVEVDGALHRVSKSLPECFFRWMSTFALDSEPFAMRAYLGTIHRNHSA